MRAVLAALCAAFPLAGVCANGFKDGLAFVQQQTVSHVGLEQGSVKQEPAGSESLMEFVMSVVDAVAVDALHDVVTELPPTHNEKNAIEPKHGLILNVTLKDLSQRTAKRAFSSFSDKCSPADGPNSISCLIPLGDTLYPQASQAFTIHAEKGSYLTLKASVEFGGNASDEVNHLMPEVKYTVPLCGEEPQNFQFYGRNMTVGPPKCGDFTLELNTLAVRGLQIAERPFKIPAVSSVIEPLLPMHMPLEMDLKQLDGSKIATFGIVTGVATM